MGVQTVPMADFTSPVAPARFFKAVAIDNHNLLVKVCPEFVKSIEIVQGDPTSVGCVKLLNFPEGSPFKYVKTRVDEIDINNFYLKYTSIEGDVLGDHLECAVYENKFAPSGTGCHYKMTAHYHNKGDSVVKEQDIATDKSNIEKMFKAVEAYLIANPQVYA